MAEHNNGWIGDFHKALEERKEPASKEGEKLPFLHPEPAQYGWFIPGTFGTMPKPPAPAPAPPANPSQGLADWVKRMGGDIGPKPGGVTFVPDGWFTRFDPSEDCYRVSAEVATRIGGGDIRRGYARLDQAVSDLVTTTRIDGILARAAAEAFEAVRVKSALNKCA